MIEEQGQVMAVEPGAVWVQTFRRTACGKCQAKSGCGHNLIEKLVPDRQHAYIKALNDYTVQVGDEVVIGIEENTLINASVLVYLLPLCALLFGLLLGHWWQLHELASLGIALALLLLAFIGVRNHSRQNFVQKKTLPIVLSVKLAAQSIS
ncbi:SoxR reducing system RseC family protein [Zooshikella sp. RANM57]|uniref:SoxR reducing system RseC family protein n=1 Tax=Zooshikella sp. RANM57 TaxID=3425863 RepID=UPI003D701F38